MSVTINAPATFADAAARHPRRTYPRTIAAAVQTVRDMVADGLDYADAEWRASIRHRVSAERIRAAYDAEDAAT